MQALMASPIGDMVDQMSNIIGLMHDPKSRGSVEAQSLRSSEPPAVTANYFAPGTEDLNKQITNLKSLINIAEQKPLDPWVRRKAFENLPMSQAPVAGIPDFVSCLFKTPGQHLDFISLPCLPSDDANWGDFLRENYLSTYHYFGTAAMGSVVESGSFQVKGVQGLHVVDASVIPRATRVNPVGTVMTIGHFVASKLAKASPQ